MTSQLWVVRVLGKNPAQPQVTGKLFDRTKNFDGYLPLWDLKNSWKTLFHKDWVHWLCDDGGMFAKYDPPWTKHFDTFNIWDSEGSFFINHVLDFCLPNVSHKDKELWQYYHVRFAEITLQWPYVGLVFAKWVLQGQGIWAILPHKTQKNIEHHDHPLVLCLANVFPCSPIKTSL